ncbi:MAG: TonB-dependent receptor [Bacteroidetes bacterium]|nr:MAG: TonB-dependent receptor [Bacteroidota bacterium]
MSFRRSLFTVLAAFAVLLSSAQATKKGTIKGKVIDKTFVEELTGVQVVVKGTTIGTITDISGIYLIDINPGTYTLEFTYVGMAKKTVQNVVVKAGEVTTLNVEMSDNLEILEEAVVTAKANTRSAAAVTQLQRNSAAVQDNIGAENIARMGTSNAAESMKQVTGASVEGGKFIVMRGLGDRYSITQMNGVTLPSTDPYRNASSMDLIPAGMIENILTSKTFTPDQPGNFTGGNVNVNTKTFPDHKVFTFSMGLGLNNQSSFQQNFLTTQGGKWDWAGFDDGTRKLKQVYIDNADILKNDLYIKARNPKNEADRAIFNETARGMRPESFVNETNPSFMNNSFSTTYGNRHLLKNGHAFGYMIGVNASHDYSYYEGGISNAWKIQAGQAERLIDFFQLTDRRASENATIGTLANLAYQWGANEVSLNILYNHDGEKVARQQEGSAPQILSNPDAYFFTSINYLQERTLSNIQLRGEHKLGKKKNVLSWVLGTTGSSLDQPDMKLFAYKIDKGFTAPVINPSEFDLPSSFFRSLNDRQFEGKIDYEMPFKKEKGNKIDKIKFGAAFSTKNRTFSELRYRVAMDGVDFDPNSPYYTPNARTISDAGTPEAYFVSSNFGMVDTYVVGNDVRRYLHSNFIYDQTRAENKYTGTENIGGLYAMGEYNWRRWKFIGGARAELTDINVVSEKKDTAGNFVTGNIEGIDILPSLNIVYEINSKSNMRAAATQTLARPNMRELAPFAALDFIGGFIYEGTPDVKRTKITNLDLRWEYYPNEFSSDLYSVSAFFKDFKNPIIQVFDPLKPNPTIKFANVESAQLYGLEFELRRNLGAIHNKLKRFDFSGNFSYIYSISKINPTELAAARNNNPDFPESRPFQGQSPYLINAALTYKGDSSGFEATASFNLFGTRLSQVGTLGTPDIYERPIPMFNINLAQKLNKHWNLTLRFNNILNASYQTYQIFKGEKYISSEYKIGFSTSFGVSYKL